MFLSGKIQSFVAITTLAMTLAVPSSVFAFRNGPPAGANGSTASGGVSCKACHGADVGAGSVQILGAPSVYRPGTIYPLTVRVEDASQVGAGFQISVENAAGIHTGFLVVSDFTNTQFNQSWINHNGTGVTNSVTDWASLGNAAEYNVQWEAPPTDEGPITFWAVGNAINNNSIQTGDIIYLTNTTAVFGPPVPTVSQWGMMVMLLLIMTAATLVIGRNQSAVASPIKN